MAKDNKPASAHTGFEYPAGGGDDIGEYKQPMPVPSSYAAKETDFSLPGNPLGEFNISVAGTSKGNVKGQNPYGVGVMRGFGAATKGKKISGKMG
jgi:hypothetical protein